jgi:hypothetical protein
VDWVVKPHGPLEQLADNLWRVEGSTGRGPLMRVMTVVRRSDGRLLIHSAIALDEPGMRALEALGPVALMLVPNGFHRMDAPRYKARYPELKVYAPRGSRARIAEKVAVDGTYEELPADPSMHLEYLDGVADGEGVLWVHHGDGHHTLVLNDLVFNMPHAAGPAGIVVRYVFGSSGGPRVSRLGRLALIRDKARAKSALERLADTPGLERVVVSHHQVIARDPAGVLRAVAAAL